MNDSTQLQEAISHLDDLLSRPESDWSCVECKNDHIQLKNWLLELQRYRLFKSYLDENNKGIILAEIPSGCRTCDHLAIFGNGNCACSICIAINARRDDDIDILDYAKLKSNIVADWCPIKRISNCIEYSSDLSSD